MSVATVHYLSMNVRDGIVTYTAPVNATVSETFTFDRLQPSTGYTVSWGDASGNSTFTSNASGTGSAAHTYATTGSKTITVTNTTTGQVVAVLTFTVAP